MILTVESVNTGRSQKYLLSRGGVIGIVEVLVLRPSATEVHAQWPSSRQFQTHPTRGQVRYIDGSNSTIPARDTFSQKDPNA